MEINYTNLKNLASLKIECLPEETPIRGNALASGDDALDKEIEDAMIEEFNNGNEWRWCCVKVSAYLYGFECSDYLGCCSYASEADFKADGYYMDMCITVYQELGKTILNQFEAVANGANPVLVP